MSPERLPVHPYAELFPLMAHPDFDALCGHIATNGLQEEIVLHEGQILDGRNRYLACLAGGVAPRFRAYAGECGSPLAFVVAKNVRRRHLTESQRALLAARLKPLFEEEAHTRQVAGLRKGHEFPVWENSPKRGNDEENIHAAAKAAEMMHVSDFSVKAADKVKKQGVPALVAAVQAGKIVVSAAARIAKLPAEQQQKSSQASSVAQAEAGARSGQRESGGTCCGRGRRGSALARASRSSVSRPEGFGGAGPASGSRHPSARAPGLITSRAFISMPRASTRASQAGYPQSPDGRARPRVPGLPGPATGLHALPWTRLGDEADLQGRDDVRDISGAGGVSNHHARFARKLLENPRKWPKKVVRQCSD